MPGALAGLVLAAGAGTRLAPLTRLRPKPLCPVGDRPLVEHALARVRPLVGEVAVNVHHHRAQLEAHLAALDPGVHVSVEADRALGTAGAVAHLRPWLDGRPVVVVNGDTWAPASLAPLVEGWDGERVRVAVFGDGPLGPRSRIAGALLPPPEVARLDERPSGLWEVSWQPALADGRLDTVVIDGPAFDCGTPADYLAANLAWSGGESVVGEGARVEGELVRSVVWPGARVAPGERLVEAIRADSTTVLVRGGVGDGGDEGAPVSAAGG